MTELQRIKSEVIHFRCFTEEGKLLKHTIFKIFELLENEKGVANNVDFTKEELEYGECNHDTTKNPYYR